MPVLHADNSVAIRYHIRRPTEGCHTVQPRGKRFDNDSRVRGVVPAVRRGVHPAAVSFLALDPKGNPGAACTVGANFQYAVARRGNAELIRAKEIAVEGK